jgi:hypothetical protein
MDNEGTITVRGTGGDYQVTTGPNSYGGPLIVSVFPPGGEKLETFKKVDEAIQYLKGAGVSSQNLRRFHRELPTRFKEWQTKSRDYKGGPFGYSDNTHV